MQYAQGQIATVPNFITIARLVMVPTIVWLTLRGQHGTAFWLFAIAGLGDAVDGYLARQFNLKSWLGAYLDPLADKALLVSIYVALAVLGQIPPWLAILVVGRDVLIVAGVGVSWMLGRPVAMQPLVISKINTLAQVILAAVVLADLAFSFDLGWLRSGLVVIVAALVIGSTIAYAMEWARHFRTPATETPRA
jgi:cardiolipin synthase